MSGNELPPEPECEFDASDILYIEEEPESEYEYIKSDEINKTVKVYPEEFNIFYTLFKYTKAKTGKKYKVGKRQAELIMVVKGNKILYDIFTKYHLVTTTNFYRRLILIFPGIPAVKRIPELNLGTVFNTQGGKFVSVHMTDRMHDIITDWAELLSISDGYVTYLSIMLYFNLSRNRMICDDEIKEYIQIKNRLENAVAIHYATCKNHLLSMINDMKEDIEDYQMRVNQGKGDAKVLARKQKMLDDISDMNRNVVERSQQN